MRHTTEMFVCGLDPSGLAVGPVDNDVEDPEGDPRTPPGWLAITVRRVVENPDYAEAKTADDILDGMLGSVPPEQQAQARAALRPFAELAAVSSQATEPRYVVQEVEMHLSPAYADRLFDLDQEAFLTAGWIGQGAEEGGDLAAVDAHAVGGGSVDAAG